MNDLPVAGEISTREKRLNNFARRAFRDIADQDYIAARHSHRIRLFPQFHWLALQAIEKYLKGILLYNRVRARNLGHDLEKALDRSADLPFDLRLSDSSRSFITHLDTYGRFRYLETSYHVVGPMLLELDRAVWEIRRYCRFIHYCVRREDRSLHQMLPELMDEIDRHAAEETPTELRLAGGFLEQVIDSRDHPARPDLIWQNGFFGTRRRETVTIPTPFHATYSPLANWPEMLDEIREFVHLPKDVADAYRERLREKGEH